MRNELSLDCLSRDISFFVPYPFNFIFTIDASIDIWTVVAVFCLRLEDGAESGFDVGFVEGAVVAVLGEIGVVLGEDGAGLGGIAGETGMGSVARRRNRRERWLFFGGDGRGGLVGGGEGTLAVPAVAGAVLVPEGVVDGEDGVPVETVVGSRIGGGGGKPFEVGENVLLGEELLPLGGLTGTEDGCVVFCFEPWSALVGGYGEDFCLPLFHAK